MHEAVKYQIWNPLGDYGAFEAVFAGLRDRGFEPEHFVVSVDADENRTLGADSERELAGILKHNSNPDAVRFDVFFENRQKPEDDDVRVILELSRWYARSSIYAPNIDLLTAIRRLVEDSFGLKTLDRGPRKANAPQARAVIGCHFDGAGLEAANRVIEFLRLLRFDRAEILDKHGGATIPEKVRDGIIRNDIYIGVVTGSRDHQWITAESAFALGHRKTLILIEQSGSGYRPTMEGHDFERIVFGKVIDESFIKLLQAFRSHAVIGI